MATQTRTRGPLYSSPVRTADGQLLPTRGPQVCRWIEATCVYGEGDYFGQPVKLRPFQRRFLYRLYEFYPETNRRRYRRAVWGLPKSNGKTPIGAFVGAVELAGGITTAPHVLIGAASLKQANHVFGDLATIAKAPVLAPYLETFDLEILLKGGQGVAERIAAAIGTNDGARASAFIADELHEWIGRLGNVFWVADGAIAKRINAFALAISTAGVNDDQLVLKQLYDYGVRVSAGEVIDDAYLFEWYEAPPGLDPDDPVQWREGTLAANPAAGDFCPIENIRSRFDGASRIPRSQWLRYHWNQWVLTEEIWEPAVVWPTLEDPNVGLDPALPLFVGIDVGITHDSSGVVSAQLLPPPEDAPDETDGLVPVRARIWENPYDPTDPQHDEWRFDTHEVANVLRELRAAFPVGAREAADAKPGSRKQAGPAFFYDPNFFETEAADLRTEGLNMIAFPQHDSRMIPAAQALFQLTMTGRIRHDGDTALARHMRSVVPHEKPRGFRISKPRGSRTHIDGAIAAAIATSEATRPEAPKRRPLLVT